ncbi:hypothetical protein [Williamsia sp. Leaf354]|jgi:hypothetical protein|uniref:hypothetical protein n=1 Tax=Williamsia sp. Leaf354 TaxID=1736349 RepID=UPI000A8FB077|nr:hypothetical protein [Williamsia sp. Leaf354]
MKIRTALVSAAVTVATATGVVTATPANAAPAATPRVDVSIAKQSVSLSAKDGSLRTKDDMLEVLNTNGRVVRSMPLKLTMNNVSTPVKTSIKGRTATLTPQIPGRVNANAYFSDPPRTRKQRDDQALATLADNLGVATGVGGLVGSIIGGGLGCVILIATGCLPGLVTGAGIGGTIGSLSAGGPVLIGNINEYFKTIRSPFTPPPATPAPGRPNPVPPPTVPRPIR